MPSVAAIWRALSTEGWSRWKVCPLEDEDDAPGNGDNDDDALIERLIH